MKTKTKLLSIAMVFLIGTSTLSIFTHQTNAATSGLVGYWKFDEGSGTIAHDSSGNGNDGTVYGASWTNGISNGALQFDGLDDYVGISSSPSLTLSGNEISLEMWIRPTATLNSSLSSHVNIMDKANAYGFEMFVNGGGRMDFFVNIGGADQWLSSTTNDWIAGSWYLIAGTYDGSSEKIYVNGVLENTTSLSGNLSGLSGPLSIGSYCYGTMWFFSGAIEEVKIYNYARTSSEILNDYNSAIQSQVPLLNQWWFWMIVGLGAVAVVFACTTVYYARKPSTASKQASVAQSKSLSRTNKVCPKCGANLPADSKFCGKCGTSLE
jgi:ribosomal protein L40E